jgi:hypothetical protein
MADQEARGGILGKHEQAETLRQHCYIMIQIHIKGKLSSDEWSETCRRVGLRFHFRFSLFTYRVYNST